jgi:adenylate cyclase
VAYIVFKANRIEIENSLSIGRANDNELIIDEPTVSRNHALIKKIGEKFYIIDSGSSNGTFRDGKRIHSPILLENKSVIQCGNAQCVFYDNSMDNEVDETQLSITSNFIINSVVLIADIRGYTTFAETTPVKTVSRIMAKWFKAVTNTIEEHNGYIDSFIGDCVYARWDYTENNTELLKEVLIVAKTLNEITKKISSDVTNNEVSLSLGVGINVGEVIVGVDTNNTGLGDTVNTAFRFEAKTRELNSDIVVSKDVADLLDLCGETVTTQIKGKNEEVQVCTISFDKLNCDE